MQSGLDAAKRELSEVDSNFIKALDANDITEENNLETLHNLSSSCRKIKLTQYENTPLITDFGLNFTNKYSNYIFLVAKYFFNLQYDLPKTFVDNLFNLIKNNRVNVVTLNHDKLLYKCLFDSQLLKGYTVGSLVDGLYKNNRFKREI